MSLVPKAGIEPARGITPADFESEAVDPDQSGSWVFSGETDVKQRRDSGDPQPFPTFLRRLETFSRGLRFKHGSTLYFPRLS